MAGDSRDTLALLRHNTGFEDPALWVDYARHHGFSRVKAVKVVRCPDCAAEPGSVRGQYVYYSTLIRLRECPGCGLIWADAHIDPAVVRGHFEVAYKDDGYFRRARDSIFEHLAIVIDGLTPVAGRVLDIGGARGDLMDRVASRRPDLRITVHDLSNAATARAATHFGFATLCGDAHVLASHPEQYDVVVLSDVLYYEPNLAVLWSALSRLVSADGKVVVRVPNKFALTRLGQRWQEMVRGPEWRRLQDRVPCYNPEHIFIVGQRYLRTRLRSLGFTRIRAIPSPPLSTSMPRVVRSAYFQVARAVNRLSRGTVVLTPSMLIVGDGRRLTNSTADRR